MAYGDGGIFRRGQVWYGWLFVKGRLVRESLHTTDEKVAAKRLAAIRRKKDAGDYQPVAQRRVLVSELLDDLLVYLEVQGRASLSKVKCHVKPVRLELGHVRAADLETSQVERVVRDWLADGKARATVNRRLEALGEAYRLAAKRTPPKVRAVPYIQLLHVENTRTGFLEAPDFARITPHLDRDLADFAEWGYLTGMRKGEAAALAWSMLDRSGPTWALQVPAAICKNRDGRVLPVVGSLRTIIERRLSARRLGCGLIFHRRSKGRDGQPIKAFDKAWRNALREAGLPKGLLFHDSRRSAARNLRRAGASESEAMKVTGHKTASMFRRYSIVTDEDAAVALQKQDQFLGRKR